MNSLFDEPEPAPRKKPPALGKLPTVPQKPVGIFAGESEPPRSTDHFGRTSDDPEYDPFDFGGETPVVFGEQRDQGIPDIQAARNAFTAKPKEYKGPKVEKDPAQYSRTIKYLQAKWPGWYVKSEHNESTMRWQKNGHGKWEQVPGASIKRDLGGFMDICGVSNGRMIGCQITTRGQIMKHICDYTSEQKSGGLGDVTTHENLRSFLANGGLFVILGYFKLGRLWECDEVIVTIADLDAAVKRKRGPKLL